VASRDERKERPAPLQPEAASAVDLLYRRYSGWLNRMLSLRLRTTAVEVDDIVQETYMRVARYAFDEASRHPKALLMRIAVNLARDNMRRSVVRGGLAEQGEETGDLAQAAIGPDQDHLLELKRVILRLPPIYRDVFVLSRFTGLTYDEIACHIGISVKTVEWRMSKALAMCAEWMRD
jgi:RNA polymerase sigma factor (sigma-70 family)